MRTLIDSSFDEIDETVCNTDFIDWEKYRNLSD